MVCLITGGSRGGMLKDMALEYALHGAKAVILMSRSKQKNQAVVDDINRQVKNAGISDHLKCHSMPGDVSNINDCI